MFEWLFRLLFKYPPLVFEQGDFSWGASRTTIAAGAIALLVSIAALLTYGTVSGERSRRERGVLVTLRTAIVVLLVLCLFRPTLILKASVPQQNFVGVLVDDSRSMTIADRDNQPRSAFVQRELTAANGPLFAALSKRFVVRLFRFSSAADRMQSTGEMQYQGTTTRLGQALDRARDELSGLPLSGLVMITDGADTSDAALDETIASLKARQVPVFTVGIGQERFARDIQVTRVETPRSVLKGTSLVVDVVLTQTGYAGRTVPLTVEDDGHIVSVQDVKLPADGESATVHARFTAAEGGARLFRFSIGAQAGEQVAENNARDALVEVRDRPEKVLYFEGEPRYEMKFVRRAVEDDKNLQVVILQRTAENKYWRADVTTPDELAGGFPKTREELFAYRALILGSVEAAAFTPDQLRMIADFVNIRGGGLLMLGGRRSFAEGGWGGTPVGDVLPVVLGLSATKNYFSDVAVRPTRAGMMFPLTQIAATEEASNARWPEMPALSTVNPIHEVTPGATVLLSGADSRRQDQIVLAYQRYGRGKVAAMPVQDSWVWRMDVKMAVSDTTHATYWRRLVRWLVDAVPDQINVSTSHDRVEPNEATRISAEVLDPAYVGVNDAHVVAHVTSPSGKTSEVAMEWTVEHDGEYVATFTPAESGPYAITVSAVRGQTPIPSGALHVRSSTGDAEYFDATMRAGLLKRLAEETGGRFFTADTAGALPEAVSYSGRGVTEIDERDLWDMPVVLLTLLSLVAAEWGYRRTRGLA